MALSRKEERHKRLTALASMYTNVPFTQVAVISSVIDGPGYLNFMLEHWAQWVKHLDESSQAQEGITKETAEN